MSERPLTPFERANAGWQPTPKPDGRFQYLWKGEWIRSDDTPPSWNKRKFKFGLVFRMFGWFIREVFELLAGKRKWS